VSGYNQHIPTVRSLPHSLEQSGGTPQYYTIFDRRFPIDNRSRPPSALASQDADKRYAGDSDDQECDSIAPLVVQKPGSGKI